MPGVDDAGGGIFGVGHWRLEVPVRHPTEMHSGQWGQSGVQEKTGWKEEVATASAKSHHGNG